MSEQTKHEYRDFMVSMRSTRLPGVQMPVELLADVGAAGGKKQVIARIYFLQGLTAKSRMDEAIKAAWLLADAIKADQLDRDGEEK